MTDDGQYEQQDDGSIFFDWNSIMIAGLIFMIAVFGFYDCGV
jgi:hypothetical protein